MLTRNKKIQENFQKSFQLNYMSESIVNKDNSWVSKYR